MQALVVAPTREIAVQTRTVILSIARSYKPTAACHACIGGLPIEQDYSNLTMCAAPHALIVFDYLCPCARTTRQCRGRQRVPDACARMPLLSCALDKDKSTTPHKTLCCA